MKCAHVQHEIPFYRHNELPPVVYAAITEHLHRCSTCCDVLAYDTETDRLITQLGNTTVTINKGTTTQYPPSRVSPVEGRSRLPRSMALIAALVVLLLITVGGATAMVSYVVSERSQWHTTLADVGDAASFTIFDTVAARVTHVQVLEDASWPLVYVNYVLPDGHPFGLAQQPAHPLGLMLEDVTVLDDSVSVGEGGVIYLAAYVSADEQPTRYLPVLVWRDRGTELRLSPYPDYPLSEDEMIALARTFTPLVPAP